MKKTMKYYKTEKGKKSYEKKLASDRKRSVSKEGLKYRAEHKRMRTAAKKKYGASAIKGKDIEKSTGRPVDKSKNRGRSGEGNRRKGKRK